MKCLCCGKELDGAQEMTGWHPACIRRFFGTASLPEIDLNGEGLTLLVAQTVSKGYTVTGVQKKLSLHLTGPKQPRLTLVNYPSGYILKPQEEKYPCMPEFEQLAMNMAETAGITVVPHALIRLRDSLAYITRRVDRVPGKNGVTARLAMEDFCQLDHKPTDEKYLGSYERCARIIDRYSARCGFDKTELFMRLVFCFLIGNSDMHLKNFSLTETEQGSRRYILSPAYDLLPVQLILTSDMEDTALSLNGKKQHIRGKDFLVFAEYCGIPKNAAASMMKRLCGFIPKWESMCEGSLLPAEMQGKMISLMYERAGRLGMI